jgi:hypothetical protein
VGAFQSAIISSGMVGIREGECRTLTEEVLEQAGVSLLMFLIFESKNF